MSANAKPASRRRLLGMGAKAAALQTRQKIARVRYPRQTEPGLMDDERGQFGGNLSGLFGGDPIDRITGQPKQSGGGTYAEITEESWDNTFGSNLVAGSWQDLAEFVVNAQNEYNVGFGSADVPAAVGRWYMVLDDGAGNEVTGLARIKTRNSNDERVDTEVKEVHTRRLNTAANDYRQQYAVGERRETDRVGEDSKVVLQFNLSPDSTGTSVDFTAAATVNQIPLTNYS